MANFDVNFHKTKLGFRGYFSPLIFFIVPLDG